MASLSSLKHVEKAIDIKAVLVDLSGTVHVGGNVIPGAIEACRKLQQSGLYVKFVTNTSKISRSLLVKQLRDIGFTANEIPFDSIVTSTSATQDFLLKHNLRPYCLIEDSLREEFRDNGVTIDEPYNCVLVGLAPNEFHYEKLNKAFQLLLHLKDSHTKKKKGSLSSSLPNEKEEEGTTSNSDGLDHPPPPTLIAIHRAKYYRDSSSKSPSSNDNNGSKNDNHHELSLGPGGFVSCLEEASGVSAIVMGKPSKEFFNSALVVPPSPNKHQDDNTMNNKRVAATATAPPPLPHESIMIGDDAIQDCIGAKKAGIGLSILVQTGKYRAGDECQDGVDFTMNSIVEAVDFILDQIIQC